MLVAGLILVLVYLLIASALIAWVWWDARKENDKTHWTRMEWVRAFLIAPVAMLAVVLQMILPDPRDRL